MNIKWMVLAIVGGTAVAGVRGGSLSAQSLLEVIPADVPAVIMADDLGRARAAWAAQSPGHWVDHWSAKFAIDTQLLAQAVSGPIVRSAVVVDKNRTADVIVGRVGDTAAADRLLQDAVARLKTSADRYREINDKGARGIVAQRSDQPPDFRRVVVLAYREHLVLANDSNAANEILSEILRGPAESLASSATVQAIRAKLKQPLPDEQVRMFWYYNPWAAEPPDRRAQQHGLDGIKGSGGSVSIFPGGAQALHTVIHAPPPRTGSLRMLDLSPDPQLSLPDWVVDDRQHVVMVRGNVPAALERMGPVFDELFAEGAEGTYEDVLLDLKDPDGLNVDLKRELFPLLGPHAVYVKDCLLAEDENAHRASLIALEARDSAKVARIIDRLMEGDRQASQVKIAGANVWRLAAEDDAPDSATTVAFGYALYCNDIRLLERILSAGRSRPLEQWADFRRLKRAIVARRGDPCVLLSRARGDGRGNPAGQAAPEWRSPLDVLFADSWSTTFDVSEDQSEQAWLVFDRLPFLEGNRVALGYLEEDGWSLLSGDYPEKP